MNREKLSVVRDAAITGLMFCVLVAGAETKADEEKWSETVDGLQIRIAAVDPSTSEHDPDFGAATRQSTFELASQVTFLVQIRNAGESKIELAGVRYDEHVTEPWPGRSQQEFFGPRIFEINLFDEAGEPVDCATVSKQPDQIGFNSANEALDPGETLTMLVTPIRWDLTLSSVLASGKYRVQIDYLGVEGRWNGRVSTESKIEIEKSYKELRHTLVWGPPKDGMRVAAEYRLADKRAERLDEFRERVYPLNSKLDVRYHFQNVTDETVQFTSMIWRQDDQTFVVKDQNEEMLSGVWYSGITPIQTWSVGPKQTVVVSSVALGVFDGVAREDIEHTIGGVIDTKPGELKIRHQMTDGWSTGTTLVTIRERETTDDPPTIQAKLRLLKPDGSFAESGFAKVQLQSTRRTLFEDEFANSAIELEGWTGKELRVYIRVPGFEEETFLSVNPKEGLAELRLTPSIPATFRLTDLDGEPVSDAEVRYFVRTTDQSGNYPFPVDGIEGPVFAISDAQGMVRLDSLKGVAKKSGDKAKPDAKNIYTFYVTPDEESGLAPTFVGPLSAGDDVGDIELGKFLEVSGTIEGTEEELARFAAHWDQPTPLVLGDGTVSSDYAVSLKLAPVRDGSKLKFRIQNLRPGKLRIIANFGPRPHNHAFVYGRRKVQEADQLFEFDLTESKSDLILKANPK